MMNFYPNGMFLSQDILNRFMELENRIKILEERIIKLEREINKDNNEPDDSLYMI